MQRGRLRALSIASAIAALACSFSDVDSLKGGSGGSGGSHSGGTGTGASPGIGGSAWVGGTGGTAPMPDGGGVAGGTGGGAPACRNNAGLNLDWAQWPMPNSKPDVQEGAPNPQSYQDNVAEDSVTDLVTGLVWQRDATATAIWDQASAYCANLKLGACSWRLPTYIELISLVDFGTKAPAIDATHFPNTPSSFFWAATPDASYPTSRAWGMNFSQGVGGTDWMTTTNSVRCVR